MIKVWLTMSSGGEDWRVLVPDIATMYEAVKTGDVFWVTRIGAPESFMVNGLHVVACGPVSETF